MTGTTRQQPPEDVSELALCADRESLEGCLRRRPEFVQVAVVQQLAEAVRQRVRVDVDEALRLAEAALAIGEELGDPASLGRGNRAKANALWYKGDLKAAIRLFDTAVTHFEQADMAEEIGRTLSSSIQPLALLGDYEGAMNAAQRARQIFRQIADPLRMARLEINVANILHRQDRFAEALASYQRAYEQLLPYKDAEATAVALHNMSVCLIILNDFERALKTYRRARELCEKNDMPLLAAQADYNIAYLYFLRGEYDTALARLRTTRELCRRNGDNYHSALCELDQSEIFLELNLPSDAARMAEQAEGEFERLGMGFERGKSLVNMAIAAHHQGESPRALALFSKAAALFAREENQAWQALVGLYRALVFFETREFEPALQSCSHALDFFQSSGVPRRAILCRFLLARIASAQGRQQDALVHCDTALRELAAIEAPMLRFQAHVLLGDLRRAAGDRGGSYLAYARARRELESLRSSLQGEELKIAFLKNKLHVYESLVQFCLERKRPKAREQAFAYIEQAKSRSLVELVLGRSNPLSWPAAEEPGSSRIRTLRQELNWYYHRIDIEQASAEGISPAKVEELRSEARLREDELLRIIRALPPAVNAGPIIESRTGALDRIRAALGARTSLLEYFQVADHIVAAVVTGRDVRIARLAPASQIVASVRMLQFQFSKLRFPEFSGREVQESLLVAARNRLERLFQDLVAPVLGYLNGEHVVIVPHGVLHCLPFHAFWDGSGYLIDRFSISYAPSAGIYAACCRKPVNPAGPSLLMGIHDRRAPWIREEIRSVAAIVPDAVQRLGRQATLEALRASGGSSRMIHIATHGLFRRDNPVFSSVQLADAYLSMYDLYQLRLPVELLTLSGCGTGLNGIAGGDEVLGLMRGLLAAGAQSLLLTLWDVHDRTTAEFMSSFYSKLQAHGDKGTVLRDAMLEIRERHPHPYFWAPFVLVGKAHNDDG